MKKLLLRCSINLFICFIIVFPLLGNAQDKAKEGSAISTLDAAPVFNIPNLSDITVDGDLKDWQDHGFMIDMLTPVNVAPCDQSDVDVNFRLGWNEEGLLLFVEGHDDKWVESPKVETLWKGDGLEIFLSEKIGSRDICQWVIAPGMSSEQKELRSYFHDSRKSKQFADIPAEIKAVRKKTDAGFQMEVLMPWSSLGIKPAMGMECAFQIWVNDLDQNKARPDYRASWFPGYSSQVNKVNFYTLRLSDSANAPVSSGIVALYDKKSLETKIYLTGKTTGLVKVLREGKEVAITKLKKKGRLTTAVISLPLPENKEQEKLSIYLDDKLLKTISLPDFDSFRKELFEKTKIKCDYFVFSGEKFPGISYLKPLFLRKLVGDYTVKTRFFDVNYQVVTKAEHPGRYGAIVEVTTATGLKTRKFITLYRQPGVINWHKGKISAPIDFSKTFGISPAVAAKQKNAVNNFMKRALLESFKKNQSSAVFLAGLSELNEKDAVVERNSPRKRNIKWWYNMKKEADCLTPLKRWSYVPEEVKKNPNKRYPMMLFLHGSAERGDDLEKVTKHGPPTLIKKGTKLPFIIIAPQCPKGEMWQSTSLKALLDECLKKYPIDPARIYLTGLSMGGYGAWRMATEYPELFAAIVPICGGGDPQDAERIKNLPIWVFHGDLDNAVPVEKSREMVKALKKLGSKVKYTEYKDVGHGSWGPAYNNMELYSWLLEQKLPKYKSIQSP